MSLFQEFECGVHFGAGENSKQEWSFTLYDFDGHGKITKEVICYVMVDKYFSMLDPVCHECSLI